jgi:hypothetical protein
MARYQPIAFTATVKANKQDEYVQALKLMVNRERLPRSIINHVIFATKGRTIFEYFLVEEGKVQEALGEYLKINGEMLRKFAECFEELRDDEKTLVGAYPLVLYLKGELGLLYSKHQ